MNASFHVAVDAFEGPFDLLLHLIARRRLDVCDVPLARITDDYLEALRGLERVDLDVATDFLVVAATLVELKATRLLPADEDGEVDALALEARDLLYARLLDYRTFKRAAGVLADRLEEGGGFVPRDTGPDGPLRDAHPPVELRATPQDLATLAASVLTRPADPTVDLSHLSPVAITVGEAAAEVVGELARAGGRATFGRLTAACRSRLEVVVWFLAVLELYKDGTVDLSQAGGSDEIAVATATDHRRAEIA
ncbi:MAG: segregation/condensation protein A [Actinobacteria bacterium]|nr:segregation/condensation protein A [Actinomycetota bacterium]